MFIDNPQKIKKVKENDSGFTLLEVIMAISILTIGLLAVASLQIAAMSGNSMSMVYTESTEKVQNIVEKLFNKDFTDFDLSDTNGNGTGGLDETDGNADHSDTSNPKYSIYWNVADNTAKNSTGWYTLNGVKTIRVIVKWQDKGIARNYKFDLLRNRI